MRRRGEDRAVYLCDVVDDMEYRHQSWYADGCYHGVVVDAKTGTAFTAHNCAPLDIPRYALAALLDDGFRP